MQMMLKHFSDCLFYFCSTCADCFMHNKFVFVSENYIYNNERQIKHSEWDKPGENRTCGCPNKNNSSNLSVLYNWHIFWSYSQSRQVLQKLCQRGSFAIDGWDFSGLLPLQHWHPWIDSLCAWRIGGPCFMCSSVICYSCVTSTKSNTVICDVSPPPHS